MRSRCVHEVEFVGIGPFHCERIGADRNLMLGKSPDVVLIQVGGHENA